MKIRHSAMALVALAAASTLALSGCTPATPSASSTTAAVSQTDIDKAMSTPTTLTFWTWVPDIQNEVDLFQKKYPNIKVNVVNTGTGTVQYPKLRTALKAGEGAPDVAQIEYQYIPSFRQTNSLVDLTPYGGAELKDSYVPWVWNQVSTANGVWSVPQDSGPLGNLYRSDIYSQAGLTEAPATWADFATDAQTIKSKTSSYISNLPGNDPGQIMGLFWQAGAKPFSYDGNKTVGINLDSTETQKVVKFWQGLIDKDLVSTDADFNDAWYQGFSSGKYASWQTAAWGPVFLQGTAANTSGKWSAAKIPQWNAGEDVSGNWGGSSDAVIAGTKNPIAAAELTKFINGDPASTLMLGNKQFLFPTTTNTLKSADFVGAASDFYGGQKVNELFAGVSDTVSTDFQWLPFMDYVYSSFNDTLGKAIADHTDMSAALTTWQTQVKDYASQQGFTVQ
ncbi:ABC transporter substrate-binding protein [Agreia pratensis]|uniref:ABC transporter substrate-binding protein n=1 Tax=Agreia pratensis TaxID=150121 RepID=UPI001E5C3E53|nr:extracellular solute-binding protein [Agreia pratensis]